MNEKMEFDKDRAIEQFRRIFEISCKIPKHLKSDDNRTTYSHIRYLECAILKLADKLGIEDEAKKVMP